MKFGVGLVYNRLPLDRLAEIASHAERLGFESVCVGDHLVFPANVSSEYPYTAGGPSPVRPDSRWLDPFAVLSHLAAVTSTIRLIVCVYILPLRNPFVTARAAATVDVLSHGRLELGVGVGWMREEFAIVGEDFRTRASRSDEAVGVIRTLWTQEMPQFAGRFYRFDSARFEPKPVQKPHPAIIFGGESHPALSRAARLGDGWFATPHPPSELEPMIGDLRLLRAEAGRDHLPFSISMIGGPYTSRDQIVSYAEMGVARLTVHPWRAGEDAIASLDRAAAELGLR
jgi:probable F420-dependent oxidoreductase